jgi:hypothetical protein
MTSENHLRSLPDPEETPAQQPDIVKSQTAVLRFQKIRDFIEKKFISSLLVGGSLQWDDSEELQPESTQPKQPNDIERQRAKRNARHYLDEDLF